MDPDLLKSCSEAVLEQSKILDELCKQQDEFYKAEEELLGGVYIYVMEVTYFDHPAQCVEEEQLVVEELDDKVPSARSEGGLSNSSELWAKVEPQDSCRYTLSLHQLNLDHEYRMAELRARTALEAQQQSDMVKLEQDKVKAKAIVHQARLKAVALGLMVIAPALGVVAVAVISNIGAWSDFEKEKLITERERMKIDSEKEKRNAEVRWDAFSAVTWLAGHIAPLAFKHFTGVPLS